MAVLGRRSKSVSFRLSEQEYRMLMEVCQTQGARCVSEAVRGVLHSLTGVSGRGNRGKTKSDSATGSAVETTLAQLQERLKELDDELKSLTTAVRQLRQTNPHGEEPEPSTTSSNVAHDSGLTQLTEAIGHVPAGRQPGKP
jgi:hypothetical protein